MSKWTPVTATVPYERQPVLLIAKYPTGNGWSDIYHGWRLVVEGTPDFVRWPHSFSPTHWMPLPEPPADE